VYLALQGESIPWKPESVEIVVVTHTPSTIALDWKHLIWLNANADLGGYQIKNITFPMQSYGNFSVADDDLWFNKRSRSLVAFS